MALFQLDDRVPQVHASAYVADSAELIGAVVIGEGASVWSNVTMRGDNEPIVLGRHSNVQESSVLHTDPGHPLSIGERVTVGHQAMLHGCQIGDGALIGIQAVVLNGAKIGRNCLVGAGALVTEGKVFEDGMLILGSPAKAVRPLTEEEIAKMQRGTQTYVDRAQRYKTSLKRLGEAR
ncbi:gamma carbonic anhydrase family protein [Caldimonas sp. KR1-144]|uniref:gamma carbonic anhydrase family protein n=1 Tax=Caldimonas sp. KR1-144 TaxID=3400911 RepID=UPI003C01F526